MKLSKLENDFLILLRAGLWQKSCGTLSKSPDWDCVFNIAGRQTVIGIISDGISAEGAESRLSDRQSSLFINAVAQLVRDNQKKASLQERICDLLKKNGIQNFRIVKGLEAASNYPKPHLRTSGDVDILLPYEDYLQARKLLKPLSIGEDGDYDYASHKGYYFKDGEVELHGTLHPDLGDRIDFVIDKAQDELFASAINFQTFTAFYYFLHCLQHLFFEGLGLRQVADLTMLLAKEEKNIDRTRLSSYLDSAGLNHEWEVFMTFIHSYFGMESKLFPCSDAPEVQLAADDLWIACMKKGNMGFYSKSKVTTEQFWLRKYQKVRRTVFDWYDHRRISPEISKEKLSRDVKKYFHLNYERNS